MPAYERSSPPALYTIDEYDDVVGWLAHPQEDGQRASHAISTDEGVWIVDPIDVPGVDELLADLGPVAGVAVLSDYHARDADTIAKRYDVPVHVPHWLGRVPDRLDTPVKRTDSQIAESGIRVERCTSLPGWTETIAWHEPTSTFYFPDILGTAPGYTVGTEEVGVFLTHRLVPPQELLEGRTPDRLLFGHGPGIHTDAAAILEDSITGARRRFPRALLRQGPTAARLVIAAVRE
ncbi:hypothetical protein ACFQL1_06880 [Halomicroarcula sp. GCM10025709]|uniref:hypothetical protein n=1 Tax=Haloarcula TaxID=2237 RepID=UPI0024C2D5CD|nr:hypothetical protein [Halomicroarcula sp. YJ-61-S]